MYLRDEKIFRKVSLYELKYVMIYSAEGWITYSWKISMDSDRMCKRKTKTLGVSPQIYKFLNNFLHVFQKIKIILR